LVFAFAAIAQSFAHREYCRTNRAKRAAVPDHYESIQPGERLFDAGVNRVHDRWQHKKGHRMIELERPADLAQYVGKEIGVSDWFTVDQAIIDKFAEATGDHQWIHVDVERAKREMPGGRTIAHGYLTLSLVPRLAQTIYRVKNRSRGLNYGSNRIRFTGQVPAGSRIRLRQKIKSVEPVDGGVRIASENTVEVEGVARPALVAETISMQFD
jgi:acyl dehydratase